MGTFFASRRNQLIVGGVALALILVILLVLALRGPSTKIGVTSTAASPTPSTSPSPTPEVSPSATLAPTATAAAATPASIGPVISNAGHELDAPASDVTKGNGPGCGIWVDTGFTLVDCQILPIRDSTPAGSVAYVVEKKSSGDGMRVFLMTTNGSEAFWHIKLQAYDDAGTKYTAIGVKPAHISGDALGEVLVGFRINGTGKFLTYDIVQLGTGGALTLAASRNLDHGSANISGSQLVDYEPYPNASTPDYFIRSVIAFRAGAFHIIDSSHAPERSPGDLAPPP